MTTSDMSISAPTQSPENVPNPNQTMYPLFETISRSTGLTLQPTYTCQDVASLFGVTARTVQSRVADGTIPSRRLLGGARFLPADMKSISAILPRPLLDSLHRTPPASFGNELTRRLSIKRTPLPFISAGFARLRPASGTFNTFSISVMKDCKSGKVEIMKQTKDSCPYSLSSLPDMLCRNPLWRRSTTFCSGCFRAPGGGGQGFSPVH